VAGVRSVAVAVVEVVDVVAVRDGLVAAAGAVAVGAGFVGGASGHADSLAHGAYPGTCEVDKNERVSNEGGMTDDRLPVTPTSTIATATERVGRSAAGRVRPGVIRR
jgi:hypothetical protein